MKVLVTGGYGFIGSHVVDRFYKEGHEIYIIDNLSTGSKENVKVKHKGYELDVVDEKCEEIFKSIGFDVVIHFAAQIDVKTSMERPAADTRSNILGLVNILHLSSKYGVKKFIFASSAAVYGSLDDVPLKEDAVCDPISTYGINKYLGEFYCKKWTEIFGLKTVCFRFANVFGPRQGAKGEGGVVSIFMEKLFKNEEMVVFGDGLQTRDFIYVEDLADAVYRAANAECCGVFNLSTNTETTVNELINVLNKLQTVKNVVYSEPRKGDIKRSSLNNSKIKKAFGWKPKYSLEEGIGKTFRWFKERSKKNILKANPVKAHRKKIYRLIPYIENLLMFLGVAVLSFSTGSSFAGSGDGMLDYKLLYILLFGVIYGMRQAVVSAILSSALLVSEFLWNNNGDFILFLVEGSNLLKIGVYILMGIITGYFAGKRYKELQQKDVLLRKTQEKTEFLQERFNEICAVKNEMQNQIRNSENSLGKIYYLVKKLNGSSSKEVFHASVDVLEKLMKSQKVSIHSLDLASRYLKLEAKSKALDASDLQDMNFIQNSKLKEVVFSKNIYVNRELKAKIPWMTAPVLYNDEIVALIFIHDMKFEHVTLYYENLFKVATDMISQALERTRDYESGGFERPLSENTGMHAVVTNSRI